MERFPILASTTQQERDYRAAGIPTAVPWSLVAPHERQALLNHDQTLARLADRGGLSPSELMAVLEDRDFRPLLLEDAAARLRELLGAGKG